MKKKTYIRTEPEIFGRKRSKRRKEEPPRRRQRNRLKRRKWRGN